jgi:hypothetical protein
MDLKADFAFVKTHATFIAATFLVMLVAPTISICPTMALFHTPEIHTVPQKSRRVH